MQTINIIVFGFIAVMAISVIANFFIWKIVGFNEMMQIKRLIKQAQKVNEDLKATMLK